MRPLEASRGIWMPRLGVRPLLALVAAFGLLFALLSVTEASAAEPGHQVMMGETGHCQMPQVPSTQHDKSAAKICCASIGAAVERECGSPALVEPAIYRPIALAVASLHAGLLREIATPPPRHS